MKFKRIHVIVNPASGQDRPILKTINTVFREAGIDWDMFITKEAGDGIRLAREAVDAGADAVAVYGGDGTVREAVTGLLDTEVPVVILPGGTANAMALSLGLPINDLAAAVSVVADPGCTVKQYDAGMIGDEVFLIGIGLGIPGEVAEVADRDLKDRLGVLAYALTSLQAVRNAATVRYEMVLDGETFVTEGVSCAVLNNGAFGVPGMSLAPSIDMSDGKLDVMVFKSTSLPALVSLAASVVRQNEEAAPYDLYHASEVKILPHPLQPIQVDGEVMEPGPVVAKALRCAARFVVPASAPDK